MPKPFDAHNIDHVMAYSHLCKTGVWPPEHDITERTESPIWISIIQSRMTTAWVEHNITTRGTNG